MQVPFLAGDLPLEELLEKYKQALSPESDDLSSKMTIEGQCWVSEKTYDLVHFFMAFPPTCSAKL